MNVYKSRYQYYKIDKTEVKRLISGLLRLFNTSKGRNEDIEAKESWIDYITSDEDYSSTNQIEFFIEIIDYKKYITKFIYPSIRAYYINLYNDGNPINAHYKELFKKFVKLGMLCTDVK